MPGLAPTTSWTLILDASASRSEGSEEALARFCEQYWPPVYALFRRKGFGTEASRDLTQGFFARLIEKRYLQEADPARGRFRTFLFTCAMNFGLNEIDREQALKRGGAVAHLSLDLSRAEDGYAAAPSDGQTPETTFHRRWALDLIQRSLDHLREEHAGDKAPLFNALSPHLLEDEARVSHRELGLSLRMSEGAVRVAAHRLRRRFAALLRQEIGRTLTDPSEIEDELRFLIQAVSR